MKDRILAFLADLDGSLVPHAQARTLDVYLIGRASLVWQYGFTAMTKDIDILPPRGDDELVKMATRLFGKSTPKAIQHGFYLDVVSRALPPVPRTFEQRVTLIPGDWKVLRVSLLDPNDLAATKLQRFSAGDREDIRRLCDMTLIDAELLEKSLEDAFTFSLDKDGDVLRDNTFLHLRQVQKYLSGEIREL